MTTRNLTEITAEVGLCLALLALAALILYHQPDGHVDPIEPGYNPKQIEDRVRVPTAPRAVGDPWTWPQESQEATNATWVNEVIASGDYVVYVEGKHMRLSEAGRLGGRQGGLGAVDTRLMCGECDDCTTSTSTTSTTVTIRVPEFPWIR